MNLNCTLISYMACSLPALVPTVRSNASRNPLDPPIWSSRALRNPKVTTPRIPPPSRTRIVGRLVGGSSRMVSEKVSRQAGQAEILK